MNAKLRIPSMHIFKLYLQELIHNTGHMEHKYYRHFKGNYYKLLSEAVDSENLEPLVVYRALYGEGKTWVRPKPMFFESVSREGYEGPRFTPVSISEVLRKVKLRYLL